MGRGARPEEDATAGARHENPAFEEEAEMIDAIIPARGGSKGIPRKNIRPLAGFPLLEWIVTAALHASLDHVVVSTDDPEIASVAGRCGALVVMRPADLAGDDVGDLPVLRHALLALGGRPSVVVHLRATSPFVRAGEIDAVVQTFACVPALTSMRSVLVAPGHPRKMYRDGFVVDRWPTLMPYTGPAHAANSPRQLLEPVWLAAGFIDVFRADRVLFGSDLEGPVIGRWVAPESRVVDLDTERDWLDAEAQARVHGWHPGHPTLR